MSLTIRAASTTIRTVVMMRRRNDGSFRRRSGRAEGCDMVDISGGVWDETRGFPSANSPRFRRGHAGWYDHAPGAVERAFLQLEPEQALALEAAGQNEVGGLRGGEAEPRVVGRVAEQ